MKPARSDGWVDTCRSPSLGGAFRMLRITRCLIVASVALLVLSGCNVFVGAYQDPLGYRAELSLVQREYTKYVRWGDLETAVEYVHPDDKVKVLALQEDFEQLRVTDFDIDKIEYDDEIETATARVTYHAYSMRTLVEQKIRETQKWERIHGRTWVVRPTLDGLVDVAARPKP
jgi:hypothetical protein